MRPAANGAAANGAAATGAVIGRPPVISARRWRSLLGSVALSALAYLAFSMWGGWHDIVHAAGRVGLGGAATLLALSCLNYGLRFLRWQLFLGALGQSQPWRPSLLIYLGGFALTTTPGKAGEAVRSVFLKRRGVDFRSSMAAFLSERLSDLLAVALLCLLGWNLYPPLRPLLLLALALVAAAYLLIAQRTLLARWHAAAGEPHGRRGGRLLQAARPLLGVLLDARICHAPRLLAGATALSVAAWAAEALGLFLLIRAFDADVSLGFAFFTYAIGMLAGALSFMPGGLGGAEATMIGLLVWHGQAQPVAVAVTVLVRVATLWFAVLLGVLALLRLLGRWQSTRPTAAAVGRPDAVA